MDRDLSAPRPSTVDWKLQWSRSNETTEKMGDTQTKEGRSEIGYRTPPVEHRFQKGEPSRNPGGRPKKGKDLKSIARRVALEERQYREHGKLLSASTLELVVLAVRNAHAGGDPIAAELFQFLSGQSDSIESGRPKYVCYFPEKLEHEDWLAKYGHLATRDY